jgi:UDP-N-acetylglucosamine 3-dehydrogenase
MATEYNVGLIGCGNMGKVWVGAVGGHPDCRVTLVYDPDSKLAEERAAEAGGKVAASAEQVVEAPEVDIVLICTPTHTHPEIVALAAGAGKHILCEKPMALTLDKCREILDSCAQAGVKLAIGQTLRFWGAFLEVRQQVANGVIGTPCLAQVLRGGATGMQRVSPGGVGGDQARRRWRYDTRYSGGNILEGVVHELDFVRSMFGEVSAVYCTITGKEEYEELVSPLMIQAVLDFENGSQATVRMGGTVGYAGGGSWVSGTEGTLVFDAWEGPVRHHVPGNAEPGVLTCPTTSAYELELRDLLAAIENDDEPENSGINGMRNIGLGLAMYQSIARKERLEFVEGIPVDVPGGYQYRGPSSVK